MLNLSLHPLLFTSVITGTRTSSPTSYLGYFPLFALFLKFFETSNLLSSFTFLGAVFVVECGVFLYASNNESLF
jgi:hypothetical protein